MDSVSSEHMTRMRNVFFSFEDINSDCYLGSGTNTKYAMKGVGYIRFQLKSRESLEMVETLFVLELKVNLL